MRCSYYEDELCFSCTDLALPYSLALEEKFKRTKNLLGEIETDAWISPFASVEQGFRNKAKMVVGQGPEGIRLGILDANKRVVDLASCPLYDETMRDYLHRLKAVVTVLGLRPYDVQRRRGELKNILITQSPSGRFMLRFVLASTGPVGRIRKMCAQIIRNLPETEVLSTNILPIHVALPEGDQEFILSSEKMLRMPVGQVPLYLQPGGFFQTNSAVAAGLYSTAATWVAQALEESGGD
ncbi:hypothetical protein KRX54_03870 [Actinomycetaceae bacterium TAE3-ERU4]|nr:hypothetical protein [Actinomycetaceae bacterium TAE3-ERU4]